MATLEKPDVLFEPLATTLSVGPQAKEALIKLVGETLADFLFHMPVGVIDRTSDEPISELKSGQVTTQKVKVEEYIPSPPRSRAPFKVYCSNDTGEIVITFFRAYRDSIVKRLPLGQERVISGKIERYKEEIHMSHPDYIVPVNQIGNVQKVEPVYPLTAGITLSQFNRIMKAMLAKAPDVDEWIDPSIKQKQKWMDWKKALNASHYPKVTDDCKSTAPARCRLAYDELLANQLSLVLSRDTVKKQPGQTVKGDGRYRKKLLDSLPFTLTGGQEQVLDEIYNDMEVPTRMTRLLQGDVGSGKTIVALLAMLNAVEEGHQVALMAPTEILGQQHFQAIQWMLHEAGLDSEVRVAQLTGRDKGAKRKLTLHHIESGHTNIVIGTHALFQKDVNYKNLGLAVIDEQHRFGVNQRLSLSSKGQATDVLLMTATPIPRTLTLTFFGDMDVSLLKEKPANRKPIETRVISVDRMQDVVEGLKRAIAEGNRVYWICPLVEESEKSDIAAAESRFQTLKMQLDRVGLVHGKMKSAEKDKVMQQFQNGQLDVLVATTVVEVGVNVPEATIMVIEHAERFGLAQLHQLRGRVGRGEKSSSCVLLYSDAASDVGRKRLKIMRESEDGFFLAEQDLVLRGAGELLGTRQSGFADFKLADMKEHGDLLLMARDDAKWIIETDPELKSERGASLRVLLKIFGYQEEMAKFLSG